MTRKRLTMDEIESDFRLDHPLGAYLNEVMMAQFDRAYAAQRSAWVSALETAQKRHPKANSAQVYAVADDIFVRAVRAVAAERVVPESGPVSKLEPPMHVDLVEFWADVAAHVVLVEHQDPDDDPEVMAEARATADRARDAGFGCSVLTGTRAVATAHNCGIRFSRPPAVSLEVPDDFEE